MYEDKPPNKFLVERNIVLILVVRIDAETIKRPNMTDSDIGVLYRINNNTLAGTS